MYPLARNTNIVVQELEDEVLVCDLNTQKVFCLNKTAGEVWKRCDGKTEVNQITKALKKKFRAPVDEKLVWFALEELAKENLLSEKALPASKFSGLSRREVIKRVGTASVIALPVISSAIMPAAVQAASGSGCQSDANCSGATPACRTVTHTCVQCTANNSTGCTGATPACNTTTNTCVQCTASNTSACVIPTPACNQITNSCVQCTTNSDCPAATPNCNVITNTCTA